MNSTSRKIQLSSPSLGNTFRPEETQEIQETGFGFLLLNVEARVCQRDQLYKNTCGGNVGKQKLTGAFAGSKCFPKGSTAGHVPQPDFTKW